MNANSVVLRCFFSSSLVTTSLLIAAGHILAAAPDYMFNTIAGAPGFWGSVDGTNRNARFDYLVGITVDTAGNLFVTGPSTIRKVTPLGLDWIVSTPVGMPGAYGGVDGTNTAARFIQPNSVAADRYGNIYVGDRTTIRRMTHIGNNWVVTTIAGVAGQEGSADGIGTDARFYGTSGIAVDDENIVYVSDGANFTIRKISPTGSNWLVTTIAGKARTPGYADGTNSQARFSNPWGLALDAHRNLYVAGYGDETIRKLTQVGTNWVVTTIAGLGFSPGSADGTNQDARFDKPAGVAVDNAGNVYVADCWNRTVRKVSPMGTNWVTTTIGGLAGVPGSVDGTNSAARFGYLFGIAVDVAGNLYVGDSSYNVVRQGVPNGSLTNIYPVALCQRVVVVDATNGLAEASVDDGSFDPDGDPITLVQLPPGPYPLGSNIVTLTVTDSKGASSQCVGEVIVRDSTPPWLALTNLCDVQMNGLAGQTVIVQSSTDMVHWVTVTTNTLGSLPELFSGATPTNAPSWFYRLKLWP